MIKGQLPKGIRRKPNGRYEVRVKRDGKSYSVYCSTITEAKKKKTELEYQLEHGIYVEKSKITFEEWFQTWMREYKQSRIKSTTFNTYQKYYEMALKDSLGAKKLTDIRGEHIQKLYNDLSKEDYAIQTIKIISAIINGCFRQALKNGLIERNPVEQTELPRDTGCVNRKQAMTREQQELFMKYAENSYLFNLFAVLLRTGMRGGEIRGLKYSDIDKKKKVIHVQRTLVYIEGKGYFENTPKTKTSLRDIPLTDETLKYLDAQKNYWGFKIQSIDRYLFCNEEGKELSRDRVQSEIDRIVTRIRSDGNTDFPRITAHIFRHTFATRAIENGMPPQVLKTILGHSSLAMTMDLYSHVLPDTKLKEMEKIDSAFI